MTPGVRAAIADFARRATPETMERLAGEVELIEAWDTGVAQRVGAQFADPAIRHTVVRLLDQCLGQPVAHGRLLAECLRVLAFDARWRTANERLELVWSGPRPAGATFRRSDEALLQVVREARSELSIVTFAAYRVASVVEALRDAIRRGVLVRFFGETEEASDGRLSRDAAASLGRELASRLEIFEWPRGMRPVDATGHRGLLHAKFAVADDRMLFVSSANLTEAALDANMEMGVLIVGGGAPPAAQRHLARLIAEGTLSRVGPA